MAETTYRENAWTCFFVGLLICAILYAIGHFVIGS